MPRVKCGICGKFVITTKANYTYANDMHQHKKCPSVDKLSDEEKRSRRELTDAIENHHTLRNLSDYGLNWTLITKQIKDLKERGYSYEDQLYALNYVVERDGGYWGYGRIGKFIAQALHHRGRVESLKQKKKEISKGEESENKLKVVGKPNIFGF